jgi:hypothetical protein
VVGVKGRWVCVGVGEAVWIANLPGGDLIPPQLALVGDGEAADDDVGRDVEDEEAAESAQAAQQLAHHRLVQCSAVQCSAVQCSAVQRPVAGGESRLM